MVGNVSALIVTPYEASCLMRGEGGVPSGDVQARLGAELAAGAYASRPCQEAAVRRLLESWADASDLEWVHYIEAMRRYAVPLGVADAYDKVEDFSFWVRVLGHAPAFKGEKYASILRDGYISELQRRVA